MSDRTVDACINFITYQHGTGTCIPSARMLFPCWGRSNNTLVGRAVKSPPPSLRGFTLIELILVLVIIGFLTSLVAPAITSSTGLRLKTTVRRLAAGLRFARSQAVLTGNTYQVIFDVENGAMTIEPIEKETPYARGENGEGSWDTGKEEEERRALQRRQEQKTYTLPEDVTLAKVLLDGEEISEGQVLIEFYPNGSCSGGDVFVMDTKERTYRIGLEFLTGIVTIREEEET